MLLPPLTKMTKIAKTVPQNNCSKFPAQRNGSKIHDTNCDFNNNHEEHSAFLFFPEKGRVVGPFLPSSWDGGGKEGSAVPPGASQAVAAKTALWRTIDRWAPDVATHLLSLEGSRQCTQTCLRMQGRVSTATRALQGNLPVFNPKA